jgi:hypothetical protein
MLCPLFSQGCAKVEGTATVNIPRTSNEIVNRINTFIATFFQTILYIGYFRVIVKKIV